jgi:hypothetical protein
VEWLPSLEKFGNQESYQENDKKKYLNERQSKHTQHHTHRCQYDCLYDQRKYDVLANAWDSMT